MGVMRFVVHPAELFADWPEVYRAYISGVDQAAWPTRIEVVGNQILCRRQNSDSGKLNIAWPVPGFGRPVLATASLPEREDIYVLAVELARGKIVQIRNQLAAWQSAGMAIPEAFVPLHREAHQLLARSVAARDDPARASAVAQEAILKECQAAEILTNSYVSQRLDVRHRQYPQLPTVLGCSLGDSLLGPHQKRQFLEAFNGAAIPAQWRYIEPEEGVYRWATYDAQVEWAIENNLLLRGGPLVDLSPNGLPKWLSQWEHDYWNLQSFVCDFIETVMSRYLGRIRIWEVAARPNAGGALTLTEENRLTLVAKILEVARQVDQEGQFLIRIDQPWGEYQARGQHKLSPMHFADALIRAGMELSAINLEIGIGYSPLGSPSRDLVDFSRMIDQWSALGLPLQVTLAFPSGTEPDANQTTDLEVDARSWKQTVNERAQAEWIDEYIPLLLAKPAVLAVFWNHLSDAQPHRFPHAGLVRPDGSAKPSLERFVSLRELHWS
ncbi:MAG TPA: endo-1,4-beta-xylanase [Planctomycetaceae bacterium]|nr:endo-1,4-beta-xylanase [Planctomycetaceae bacterium]